MGRFSSAFPKAHSNMKLFVDLMSQPSRAVMLFCKLNNIPYELQQVSIAKLEQRSAEFRKINPVGQLPAMQDDDGFCLAESATIFRYLATTRRVGDSWYPLDAKKRAIIDRALDWHLGNLRKGAAGYFAHSWLLPKMNLPASDAICQDALALLKRCLKMMDATLSSQQFLTGSDISMPDLLGACEIAQLKVIPFDLSPYPNVIRWLRQIEQLPPWAEVNMVLDKVAAKSVAPKSKL
eukprot:GILJ01004674.1.p1 GENE.GILJ01004674.1~~GILJ01004674.1.p1  ORF type:complete len:236 (+),score=24.85 GILJ01004674.1:26-733(+)